MICQKCKGTGFFLKDENNKKEVSRCGCSGIKAQPKTPENKDANIIKRLRVLNTVTMIHTAIITVFLIYWGIISFG